MTQPESHESIPKSDADDATAVAVEAAESTEPQPEPWTPERVTHWNSYYDMYVMLGVLLLAFAASANKITHSSLWNHLQVGKLIAAKSAPIVTDYFSYTIEKGTRWVNVPWLFDWSHALLYKAASDLAPKNPNDPVASAATAEQVAAGTLVVVSALIRLLTALILIRIRHVGPGKWWTCLCVVLALGATVGPAGRSTAMGVQLVLGGVAGPAAVAPGTWGLLFLALELWIIYRSFETGRRNLAFALVPLFALWANVDESFFPGLLVLAAAAIGLVRPGARDDKGSQGLGLPVALGVLGLSVLACLLNPSFLQVYRAGVDPLIALTRPATDVRTLDQLPFFGAETRRVMGDDWYSMVAYLALLVAAGFGSFVLNRRRFSLSRFLVFATAALLWCLLIRFGSVFAVVLAATLSLNGQEWYQGAYGTEGRIGKGWSLWSVGGRAVTIVLVFLCVGKALTGWGVATDEARFGFGFDPDEFAFESADFLKAAPIRGNILNTMLNEGDALIWRAYPERKTFIDSRQDLFPVELRNSLQDVRKALSEDNIDVWKPVLDRYEISTLMLHPAASPNTFRALSLSPNWIPFYDDGAVALFGRSDAREPDLAFFKSNRLAADQVAYQRTKPTPSPERPPTPVTWLDRIFETKSTARPQPHTAAARRWLHSHESASGENALPDPARCLLAIREARTALASKPDDHDAFLLLATAYRALMAQESALMAGLSLAPENAEQIARINPRADMLKARARQRVTALNYALQTARPPKTAEDRQALLALNMELLQIYSAENFVDLARDRLAALLDKENGVDLTAEARAQLSQDLAKFNEQVNRIQEEMTKLTDERQYGPIQLAGYAVSQGAPGLAIHELEEAERTGANPAAVKPQLIDLYCETGQPERAVEMLSSSTIDDPSLGLEPGVSPMRQARAYFLLGNSDYAATLFEKYAIPRLRYDRVQKALAATQALVRGEPKGSTEANLGIPDKIALQAGWEYEAGLIRLEAGTPDLAAEHFTKALTLIPNLPTRPIIAYYLEKLGKPVPPLSAPDTKPTEIKDAGQKPVTDQGAKK